MGYSIGYTYDALKRLTATTMGQGQTFSYDGFGNLTAKSVPAGSAEPVFPGVNSAKNQLTGVPYDANGNITALNNAGLGYDMENRLTTVTSGSSVETHKYDAANHQVEVLGPASNADAFYFYGPNGKVLATFSLSLSPGVSWYSYFQNDWVYFGGTLLGTTQGYAGSETSSIVDRLGTGHPGYAYGTDIANNPGSGPLDFATYLQFSMAGFEYADQRWYSAGYGRFLTTDPFGGSASTSYPQSWNRYLYAGGDPTNQRDPSGLDPYCGPNGTWDGEGCTSGPGDPDPIYNASLPTDPNENCVADPGYDYAETGNTPCDIAPGPSFASPGGVNPPQVGPPPDLSAAYNQFAQQNNFLATAGVLVLDGLGGLACGGSGVCEVVVVTATIGVGV